MNGTNKRTGRKRRKGDVMQVLGRRRREGSELGKENTVRMDLSSEEEEETGGGRLGGLR